MNPDLSGSIEAHLSSGMSATMRNAFSQARDRTNSSNLTSESLSRSSYGIAKPRSAAGLAAVAATLAPNCAGRVEDQASSQTPNSRAALIRAKRSPRASSRDARAATDLDRSDIPPLPVASRYQRCALIAVPGSTPTAAEATTPEPAPTSDCLNGN